MSEQNGYEWNYFSFEIYLALSVDAASALALFQKDDGRTLFLSHLSNQKVIIKKIQLLKVEKNTFVQHSWL